MNFTMNNEIINVSWLHFKDFIQRYNLVNSVKYASDGNTYIIWADGYAFKCAISIDSPAGADQEDFEAMFDIS